MVGRPGKFVAVQVKCTIAKLESGEGYICSTCSSHKPYKKGSFDYLAAYVIPEDAWYIIPGKLVYGLKSISLCTVGGEQKYEEYREAWGLLRKAVARKPEGLEELKVGVPTLRTSPRVGQLLTTGRLWRLRLGFHGMGWRGCRRLRIIFGGIWTVDWGCGRSGISRFRVRQQIPRSPSPRWRASADGSE